MDEFDFHLVQIQDINSGLKFYPELYFLSKGENEEITENIILELFQKDTKFELKSKYKIKDFKIEDSILKVEGEFYNQEKVQENKLIEEFQKRNEKLKMLLLEVEPDQKQIEKYEENKRNHRKSSRIDFHLLPLQIPSPNISPLIKNGSPTKCRSNPFKEKNKLKKESIHNDLAKRKLDYEESEKILNDVMKNIKFNLNELKDFVN